MRTLLRIPLTTIAALLMLPLLPRVAYCGQPVAKHIPADAKFFVHLNLEDARQTSVYKQLLDAVRQQFPLDDTLDTIKETVGINPLTDIEAVSIYSNSLAKDNKAATILIYAKVEKGRLLDVISQSPSYKTEEYNKQTLHSWSDANDGKTKNGVIWKNELVILADQMETLKAAVDVLTEQKPGGSTLVKPMQQGTFLYAAAKLSESPDPNISKLLSSSEAATASLAETDGNIVLSVNLAAKSPEQGAQVKKLLDGLKALGQLTATDMPTAAALIHQIDIVNDGSHVAATFTHDAETLLQTLQQLEGEFKAHKANQAKKAAGDPATPTQPQ